MIPMSNELSDTNMITKKINGNKITFHIKKNVDIIWMNQKTLASFFETPFKTIITALHSILTNIPIDKKKHIRSISYVESKTPSPKSIQETQYSFYIISFIAFKLTTPVAQSLQQQIIETYFNTTKNGFFIDKKRMLQSQKRLTKFQQQILKFNNTLDDQQTP